jgi:cytochrome c-type biogenesis protein
MSELKLPAPLRRLSNVQVVLAGVGILLVVFLILGTLFSQPASPDDFFFGFETQSFATLAVLAFAGGLLSFVSPCTLPVLTAYFAFAFQSDRSRIAANTVAFMLGLATTFSLLGAAGFLLGRVLLQNQQLILLVGGAAILIFGVMSLLGRGFSGMVANSVVANSVVANSTVANTMAIAPADAQTPSPGMGGSYLFGLTFAVGWSACIGPILGAVLTLAAQATSAGRGVMLLFIYTLGLGLPLMIVSTFFGRMSRQSLFWRILRGKGWKWDTHVIVVALIWTLAIWRIAVAFVEYAFRHAALFGGQPFTAVHEYGILIILLLSALLWVVTGPQERRTTLRLHSTQLISGGLFILLGLMMLESQMGLINGLLAQWSAEVDEAMLNVQSWLLTSLSGS